MRPHVLILAGTAEARTLAAELAARPGLRVTASLAGVTSAPAPIEAETRIGGFGGAEGLAGWLRAHRVAALIDATHPFAARMAANAAEACAATGTPRLKLLRPPWEAAGDWRDVTDLAAAAAALPSGARVLLTTGRKELAPFAERPDLACFLRVIEPAGNLPPHFTQIVARPPFPLERELALMREHGITHLVAKNSGGTGRARIDAAVELGIPLLVVVRPAPPAGPLAASVGEALDWLRGTLARRD